MEEKKAADDILKTISLGDFIRLHIPKFIEDPGTGDSLLHMAVRAGRRDLCEFLIRIRRVDINAINRMGLSPLYCAVRGGHDDICELLRDNGACFRFASDAGQQTYGDRAPFFRRLRTCMEYIRYIAPEADLVQFYHRDHVPGGSFYVACSVELASDTMPTEMSTALAYLVVDARFIDKTAVYLPQAMTQSDLVFAPYAVKYDIRAIAILPVHHKDDLVGTFVAWLRVDKAPMFDTDVLRNIIFDRIESIHDITVIMRGTFESEVIRAMDAVQSSLDSIDFLRPALFLNRVVSSSGKHHPVIRRARSVLRYLRMMHVPISGASLLYDKLSWTNNEEEPVRYIHDIVDRIIVHDTPPDGKRGLVSPLSGTEVFDIIGRHTDRIAQMTDALNSMMPIDATLENLLSVARIVIGNDDAVIRTTGSVGLMGDRMYRVFAPPADIPIILDRCFETPIWGIEGLFGMHKVILECAHPFADGNGRTMRMFSTMMGRSLGYDRMMIPSHKKILSFPEFASLTRK